MKIHLFIATALILFGCNSSLKEENAELKVKLLEAQLEAKKQAELAAERAVEAVREKNRRSQIEESIQEISNCPNPKEHLELSRILKVAQQEAEMQAKIAMKQTAIAEQARK